MSSGEPDHTAYAAPISCSIGNSNNRNLIGADTHTPVSSCEPPYLNLSFDFPQLITEANELAHSRYHLDHLRSYNDLEGCDYNTDLADTQALRSLSVDYVCRNFPQIFTKSNELAHSRDYLDDLRSSMNYAVDDDNTGDHDYNLVTLRSYNNFDGCDYNVQALRSLSLDYGWHTHNNHEGCNRNALQSSEEGQLRCTYNNDLKSLCSYENHGGQDFNNGLNTVFSSDSVEAHPSTVSRFTTYFIWKGSP